MKIATRNVRVGDYDFASEKGQYVMLHYIVPTVIALKISDVNAYDEFINGRRADILVKLFAPVYIGRHALSSLLIMMRVMKMRLVKLKLVKKKTN